MSRGVKPSVYTCLPSTRSASSRSILLSYTDPRCQILKKHPDPSTAQYTVEIASFLPAVRRAPSPSSSTSSYHSSQASPPPSPPSSVLYPPDPSLPVPDVSPELVPPSALNASHRSLLSLLQSPAPPSHSEHERSPSKPGQSSKAQSLRESEKEGRGQTIRPPNHRASPSAAAAFGLSSGASSHQRTAANAHTSQVVPTGMFASAPISRHYSPLINPPATPDPFIPPYAVLQPTPQTLHRPASTSTFSAAPPINIPHTLQSIQLSLTALHERLSTLERSQAMLLRREDRRKGWFGFLTEEDEVDELEDQADRARRFGAAGVRVGDTATSTRRKRKVVLPLRVLWLLLSGVRRAMFDVGTTALLMLVAMIIFGGGWRRARRTLTRYILSVKRYILEA